MESELRVNKQIVKNVLTQSAFDLVVSALMGSVVRRFFSIRLVAADNSNIVARAATFSTSVATPGPGSILTGQSTFTSADVTSPVKFLELLDNYENVLARAELPVPLPAGEAIVITRRDTFRQGD